MTYQTKAELRAEIERLKSVNGDQYERAEKAEDELWDLVDKLEEFGFEVICRKDGTEVFIPDGYKLASGDEQAEQDVEKQAAIARAAVETRHETLQAVIDALEIKGYATGGLLSFDREGKARVTQNHFATDRFWSDIQTALEVRAERKRDEERKATEAKVAGLLTHNETVIRATYTDPITIPGPSLFASDFASDDPHLNGTCDCTVDVENTVTAVRLADSAEKAKKAKSKKEKAA